MEPSRTHNIATQLSGSRTVVPRRRDMKDSSLSGAGVTRGPW